MRGPSRSLSERSPSGRRRWARCIGTPPKASAAKTAALQAQNSAKARLELKFTQDRYRSGAVNLVDVTDARAAYERAESDRINAIFDYHKAFAALESAVGRPLR